jgi:hypothetical protein
MTHYTFCQEDSGSMTGCEPVCDAPATHLVTHHGHYGAEPYVSQKCARHANGSAARHWPDRVDVEPLQVFGPGRPTAARAAIAELRAAQDAMPVFPNGAPYDRALARLRTAQAARAAYWEHGDGVTL